MNRTPDFFEDLRRVAKLRMDKLGGQPSYRALSRGPGVSPDTVGKWLGANQLPQQVEPLLSVLRQIRAVASGRGCLQDSAGGGSDETVADLLAEERWRRSWEAEHRLRIQADREGVERQKAHKALEEEERRARQAALKDRPRPVRSWSLQRLGVHKAIPGHHTDLDDAGFVVPTYVPRPHDAQLRARLAGAVAGEASLLVMVCGESCTGKTRTAAEALQQTVPDDFQLLLPADADGLLAALAADALGPRSVLWLNEAQDYLTGPSGEAVAAALLRRLDADGPFLVIATLWPNYNEDLTDAPTPGADDPHRQARALLAQAHYIHLPDSFADALDAVRRAADHDASLAAALEAGGADLTQALAAGPDLVTHYERSVGTRGIYGKALISAAMDLHRLQVTVPVPRDFLHDAASGYLTDDQRSAVDPDTWFNEGLAHARKLIKRITRPLQDVPRPSGMGALPGVFRLADYLQQHGRRTRQSLCPPASFWDAAADHITAPADLTRLAVAAKRRSRYRHAAQFYCAAADKGDLSALVSLAGMREAAGDREGAERLYRVAADGGDTVALVTLAEMRERAGDREEAERLAHAAADNGSTSALKFLALARLREGAGGREEAERLYRAAAGGGDTEALRQLVRWREESGNWEEAERLARTAADMGDSSALLALARGREAADDRQEAERLYRAAADSGDTDALLAAARMREVGGDREEAERLYRVAADSGDASILVELARRREETGNQEEAERLARAAAHNGNTSALVELARRREENGNREEAERLARAAADRGDTSALLSLARSPRAAEDWKEVERLYRAAADSGDASALVYLGQMREKAGDREEAERLYRAAADSGNTSTVLSLLRMREEAGDREEAERLARAAAHNGNTAGLVFLALIRKVGNREEAERLARAAADSGDLNGVMEVAQMREEAGDLEEAERLYCTVADSGYTVALEYLARLRPAVAEEYERYGLEGEGALAEPWAWPDPHVTSRRAVRMIP
ncbi:tetratricopeptide repeat protein [Streptomyces sp. NPDC042638]|uniref:SEL1-like repeat protein n=1 Tax=Streptomyces sp. NPDC042638 TaxID=3154333 RepID=UPI0033F1F0EE